MTVVCIWSVGMIITALNTDYLSLSLLFMLLIIDDGHIGSLYPNRDEVLVNSDGPWVLPVAMKDPPSITLSLPVMTNAKKVVVAACGVSDKYPQGKSEGMRRAIVADDETLVTFPAVGLREVATWVMDEMAASKLGKEYIGK
jgi:6-phosphogluconolactonase